MCKKISNGTYGGCIRCDILDVLRCVAENWMKTIYDELKIISFLKTELI